jgi:hypothetical protein
MSTRTSDITAATKRAAGSALSRSVDVSRKAGGSSARVSAELVHATGGLVNRAVDQILLGDTRVASAAEGRQLLKGSEQNEAIAEDIQRVIVLLLPVVRALTRGAKLVKLPWAILVTSAVSVGVAVRSGVREIQVISSLLAHRIEAVTGAPADPDLIKKLAIDLYLHPRRKLELRDDKLHLLRLTRKWAFGGAFGRKTEKRAAKALAAAERLDVRDVAARWAEIRRPRSH